MEALKEIWNELDKKIEEARVLNLQSWALNLHWFETEQNRKAQSTLHSLVSFKIRAIIIGIVWIILLAIPAGLAGWRHPFFSISLAGIILFTGYSVLMYILQVVAIRNINYEGSITDTQNRLARLQSSTINSTRIAWLQLPFYATFAMRMEWVRANGWQLWLVVVPVILLLTTIAIWIYRSVSLKNIDKKWVKMLMMSGPEYKSIVKARDFIAEIDSFKKDLVIQ